MSTSNQFRCEIERPFTNLNNISTKLAGKTYICLKIAAKTSLSNCAIMLIYSNLRENGQADMIYFFTKRKLSEN